MDPQIDTILGPDPEPFETLISVLSNPSTSNEQRSNAELLFNLCKQTDLNTVVDKLVKLLEHSLDIDVRKMSAILLGKIFKKSKLTPSRVKISLLLDCVVKKENRPIIEVLGDTISKLAPDEKVANTLLERLASDDTSVQESMLLIFPQLEKYIFDSGVSYIEDLHKVFKSCLENVGVGSANVRIAALIAATSFIQRLMSSSAYRLQDLLPGMMQCLVEVLNGGDDAMKQKALVLLVKLAETKLSFVRGQLGEVAEPKPSFFTEQLVEVVESMLQIADTESLEEETRNLAIKFVITLVESVINCELEKYIIPLHSVFKSCLENVGVGSANVRIAALIAATSFIQCLMIDVDSFQDLLPGMMRCLVEVLNGGDEWVKQKVLVLLIKLAETNPSFFTERLVEVLWSMLQIAEAESLEEKTRDLAIEFVITLEKVSNRGSAHIHVRAMSAFLLGNLFKQCHSMSESTQLRVKEYLQDCVMNEENKPIIEILGYSISMLAPDEDVAYFIVDRVASLQESALLVFPHVVQYVMASNVPFTIRLRHVFKNRLGNVGSANVRIAALIAATSLIQSLISLGDGEWYEDFLPGMIQCLDESVNGGDEAMTQKALVLLIEFAETNPSFFTGSMSQIAAADNLEEGTRLLAKKFLITLNEAHAPDTSMPDMLEIVGNLRQFRLQEGIASDQTRTPAIEKLLRQFEEKLPPNTWASRWSSLRLKSILARKEN